MEGIFLVTDDEAFSSGWCWRDFDRFYFLAFHFSRLHGDYQLSVCISYYKIDHCEDRQCSAVNTRYSGLKFAFLWHWKDTLDFHIFTQQTLIEGWLCAKHCVRAQVCKEALSFSGAAHSVLLEMSSCSFLHSSGTNGSQRVFLLQSGGLTQRWVPTWGTVIAHEIRHDLRTSEWTGPVNPTPVLNHRRKRGLGIKWLVEATRSGLSHLSWVV